LEEKYYENINSIYTKLEGWRDPKEMKVDEVLMWNPK
jgi:hypothetical protein